VYNSRLKLRALAASIALLTPWFAEAAGLGKLTVNSKLGQPLSAQIELVSVTRDELNSLAARLASVESYTRANLQYDPALSSLRFTVEQRPGAQPRIRITSTRPVNEPVIDLLVELAWANGRISRAYTALIDPPGYAEAPSTTAAVVQPPVVQAQPIAPPVVEVDARPSTPLRPAASDTPTAAPGEYGPVKRGDTLAGIANSIRPEGVTLEQMLVGLYRANPDAFVNNMNRMKTGPILRVPAREEVAAIAPGEALKEVRVQARDWNSYRQRVADAAVAAREGSAASGRITTKVDDPGATAAPRDVVRLSKGEMPDAAAVSGSGTRAGGSAAAERLRALEEEAVARDKALNEANERIAQLEKTIREQQRLIELKGAPLGTQPEAKPAVTEAAAPDAAPAPKPVAQAKPAVVPPPPPPEPELVDLLLEEPLYLAAAGGVLVLGGLGFVLARRRRAAAKEAEWDEEPAAPIFTPRAPTGAAAAPIAVEDPKPVRGPSPEAAPAEEVDALAEAEVYIAYGRDAQAEEILKDALSRSPTRQDVQMKLLEIYAARKDRMAFREAAGRLHRQTGGQGELWTRAAGMGASLDPAEPLYAGAGHAVAVPDAPLQSSGTAGLDLNLGTPRDLAIKPIAVSPALPEAPPAAAAEPTVPSLAPEFGLDAPRASTEPAPPAAPPRSNVIDFKLDLPAVEPQPAPAPAPSGTRTPEPAVDFKLEFGDINLHLDEETPPAGSAAPEKEPHWHDVQQKFDLAKAYEEMGDKEGAREVLQEVLGEGDQEQQTRAKKLLEALV
jgi:pilus assembly protein FimV